MTKGEELVLRYLKGGMNVQEIFEFRQEARDFFKSNAPEEDKQKLRGYMESVVMICSAIKESGLEDKVSSKPIFPKKEYTFELEIPEFLKRKIQSDVDNE